MAHVDADKKELIQTALKNLVPAHWRYSLSVIHGSVLRLTVTRVDQGFMDGLTNEDALEEFKKFGFFEFNSRWPETICTGDALQTMRPITEALNIGNYRMDSEDPDTIHVGHHVKIYFGVSDERPLKVIGSDEVQAVIKRLPNNVAERKLERALAKIEKSATVKAPKTTPGDAPAADKSIVNLNW